MDARQIILEPVVSREELRADRRRQVHVPGRRPRPQDADPPRGRGDLRRRRGRGADDQGALEAEAPRPAQRPHPVVEEGDRPARAGRSDRAVRGRRGRASRMRLDDGESKDKADQPRAPLRDLPAARGADRAPSRSKTLTEGKRKSGGRNVTRPRHRAPPRRRRQAPLPRDRLQAPQGRRAGEGRDDRVRPEPQLLHRPAALRRRREELHPRPAGRRGRRRGRVRRERRHPARQRAAAARDPDRHRSSTTSSWSPARAASSAAPPAPRSRWSRRRASMVTLRLPSSEMRMVRAECRATVGSALERRAPEREDRQGRPQPPQGQAPADAAASR